MTHLLIAVVLCFSVMASVAQQAPLEPRPELGLVLGANFNIHKADFSQLGDYASCCPEFGTGTGIGATLGIFGTIPLSGRWRMMGRLIYATQSGSFISNEDSFVADLRDTAKVVPAVFSHELQASLSSFGFEPMLAYRAVTGLDLMAGLGISLVTTSTFLQTETLAEPEDYGTYLGTDRTWVNHNAEIPSAASTRFTAAIGARYIVPLTQSGSAFIAPEAFFHLPLTDVTSSVDWRVSELRLGIELGWSPVQDKNLEMVAPTAPQQKPTVPPTTIANLWFERVLADGSVSPIDSIRIEETRVVDLLPVLGHIYFDEGSAEIPQRYQQGSAANPQSMTQPEQAIAGILAIVAQRMKASSGQLEIIGCTSNTSRDKGTALARRRAIAVQDALIALGVPRNRLKVDARSLPSMPTRSSNPDDAIQAEQENRRVELVPTDIELMAPVTLASVRKTTDPEVVHVRSTVNSYPGVASSSLAVASKATSTTGTVPDGSFNEVVNIATFMGDRPSPIVATLTVRDSAGTTVVERDTLPVSLLTVERKRADRRADTEIERYSLILFAFNDAKITAEHESVLDRIRKKVQEGAQVRIIGMTDSMGSSDYNLDLSRRRAKTVANALGLPDSSIKAMGSSLPRFANASPEGRAYNRTVVIEITTNVR